LKNIDSLKARQRGWVGERTLVGLFELIELEFDLDELGLEGFKKSIDETLKQNGIPTIRWNE
jgi:hypothetical protein